MNILSKHSYHEYFHNITNDSFATYSELKHLLDPSKELDTLISKTFPLDIDKKIINVKGSYVLLEAYKRIDSNAGKLDIKSTLSSTSFLGLSDNKEVLLSIEHEDGGEPTIAAGIYKSSDQFYDIFKMSTFAGFLIDNNLEENIKPNIDYLLSKFPDLEKQFRLLLVDNNYYLRGLTSPRYKNYDNNIVIYVILYLLDKLNSTGDVSFSITRVYLTDSELKIFITQSKSTSIPDVGQLSFGAMISNNEITEGKINVELRYNFYDPTKDLSFACIPDLEDAFIQIQHASSVENAISKFSLIQQIGQQNNIMLDYITTLSKVKVLTNDIAYSLFKKISQSKKADISKSVKKSFELLYDTKLIKNTYSLIEGLNIVTDLTTNIDEKVALERIYYDLIKEISTK